MKRQFTKQYAVIVLVLLVLVSSGCSKSTGDNSVDNEAVKDATPTDLVPNPTGSETLRVENEIVYGTGEFNFPDTQEGLTGLSSYKATLTLSFEGTTAGAHQTWSTTYVMVLTQQPFVRQMTTQKTGITDEVPLLLIESDGMKYEKRGVEACMANAIREEESFGEPASFLTGVIGADVAGTDTVNGVAVNHYTFDQRALGEVGITEATGEIWVASEGGYLVKYLLTAKANADYLGEGNEGTITWDYQLTDVNTVTSIDLPSDCPAALADDFPVMPDASNLQKTVGLLEYQTISTPADVVAFYQEKLPALNWTLQGQPGVSEKAAFLIFTQSNKTLTITIEVRDGLTTVRIIASN